MANGLNATATGYFSEANGACTATGAAEQGERRLRDRDRPGSASATGTFATATGEGSVRERRDRERFGQAASPTATPPPRSAKRSTANATGATAIGQGTTASGARAFAGGIAATASGVSAVALGDSAQATQAGAVAVGLNAAATGTNAIAIGTGAVATGSVAVGAAAFASNGGAAFGDGASATGSLSAALGPNAVASAPNSVAHRLGLDRERGEHRVGRRTRQRAAHHQCRRRHQPHRCGQREASSPGWPPGSTAGFQSQISSLNSRVDSLDDRTKKVGALSSALAGLHPNPRAKGNNHISAAVGAYRDQAAFAAGYFRHIGEILDAGQRRGVDHGQRMDGKHRPDV